MYRLGRCAENASDLAAAESFLTWSLEVNLGCANAIANVQHVMKWVYGTEGGGGAGLRSQVVDAAIETLEFCKAETRVLKLGEGVTVSPWISVVERGWEGRMACKMAGRDSWQTLTQGGKM